MFDIYGVKLDLHWFLQLKIQLYAFLYATSRSKFYLPEILVRTIHSPLPFTVRPYLSFLESRVILYDTAIGVYLLFAWYNLTGIVAFAYSVFCGGHYKVSAMSVVFL